MYSVYREDVRRKIIEKFDFEKFFNYSDLAKNETGYGASVTITSDQVITVLNVKNGRAPHEFTQDIIAMEIHNLQSSKEAQSLRKKNIEMRLTNEFGEKAIFIFFPDEITEEQIELLRAYQNTYGEIVKEISIRYKTEVEDNLGIVYFRGRDGDDNHSHSLEEVVKYAESLPRVKKQEYPIEFILGEVLSSDGLTLCESSKLKSLESSKDEALKNGVTSADCNSFWGYIRGLFPKMRSGR